MLKAYADLNTAVENDRSSNLRSTPRQGGRKEESKNQVPNPSITEVGKSTRMSVNLPADAAQMLETLATSQGISKNEALRKAIATEAYFQREISEGATILVQKANNELREIVFR